MQTIRKDVLLERQNNPCATLQKIGNKFNVSKERIRQILKTENKPTRHWTQKYHCNQCGTLTKNKLFCSRECQSIYTKKIHDSVELICDNCKQPFKRSYDMVRCSINHTPDGNKLFFCSRKCRGIHAGNNYGFHVNPSNMAKNCVLKPKYESSIPQIISLIEQGKSLNNCLIILNIPKGNWTLIKKMLSNNGYNYTSH